MFIWLPGPRINVLRTLTFCHVFNRYSFIESISFTNESLLSAFQITFLNRFSLLISWFHICYMCIGSINENVNPCSSIFFTIKMFCNASKSHKVKLKLKTKSMYLIKLMLFCSYISSRMLKSLAKLSNILDLMNVFSLFLNGYNAAKTLKQVPSKIFEST